MLTRKEKEKIISQLNDSLKETNGLVVLAFNKVPVNEMIKFRDQIREANALMKVIKRRLIQRVLDQYRIDFALPKFNGQFGIIAVHGEMYDVAGPVYKFIQSGDGKIFFGYDFQKKELLSEDYISQLGQLPPKETLLAQVVGAVSAPLRALLYVLTERSKKVAAS